MASAVQLQFDDVHLDLIWEVLVRLPTKSLMRFKCVSKLWYSIIRNPKFTKAKAFHNGRYGGFLIDFCNVLGPRFFYANMECPRLMHHHFTIEKKNYYDVTQVINGLIGLYDHGENSFFTLCNIATHEVLNLPPSPPPSRNYDDYYYNYYIGFDPVKEVYKALNFTLYYDFDGENGIANQGMDINVFTLGVNNWDMEWRNIGPAPLQINFMQCLCINGTMYWLSCDQQTLAAFHLNRETFETIHLSPEYPEGGELVDICGSIALVTSNFSEQIVESLDVWTMNTHCRGGDIEAWTRKRILLPNIFQLAGTSLNYAFTSWNYAGTLPTGEMMLALTTRMMSIEGEGEGEGELDNIKLPIYIYDHQKNELFYSIIIDTCGSEETDMDYHRMNICYYEDNVISLDCLMKKQPQDQTLNIK